MKIVYHSNYKTEYSSDPAAESGRLEAILKDIETDFEFVTPKPATDQDLRLVHTERHIDYEKEDNLRYETALLAVGGALTASELAYSDEPAFGLIRPPGHHASPDSAWGFCFFCNMAISIAKLRHTNKIKKAFILDFDLRFGDGTVNSLENDANIFILNPFAGTPEEYLEIIENGLNNQSGAGHDMIAVSAGFDNYEKDWGGLLSTDDYNKMGKMVKKFAEKECNGRRYALLEGGYYFPDLGMNVKAFLEGMR